MYCNNGICSESLLVYLLWADTSRSCRFKNLVEHDRALNSSSMFGNMRRV